MWVGLVQSVEDLKHKDWALPERKEFSWRLKHRSVRQEPKITACSLMQLELRTETSLVSRNSSLLA